MTTRSVFRSALALVAALCVAVGLGFSADPVGASPQTKPGDKTSSAKKSPLPPLPPEKLPPRTGSAPDAAQEQYIREKVFVSVAEKVAPRNRPEYAPSPRVLETYLAEYLRRAGFDVVTDPAAALFLIRGAFAAAFKEALTFQGQEIAHKYRASLSLTLSKSGALGPIASVEIPEFFKEGVLTPGVPEDQVVALELRRHLAKIAWDELYLTGKALGDPEIPALLASLAADDPLNEAPVQAKNVVQALVGKRLAAVPSLLDALTDERIVRVNTVYPGLTSATADKLRVYHIADRALEEIFQKVSRMTLETPPKHRFVVIKGWENEWRRFCPSFRNSPQRTKELEALEAVKKKAAQKG